MKHTLILITAISMGLLVGCSGKSSSPLNERTTSSSTSDTQNRTGSSSNSSIFDTGSSAGNLFDTTTSRDPVAAVSPAVVEPAVTASQQACLTQDSAILNNGYYTSYEPQQASAGSASGGYYTPNRNSCLASGSFGQDFYDTVNSKLEAMGNCYTTVAMAGTQQAGAGNLAQKFQMGKMALTRCFRRILRQEAMMANWSQPVQQNNQQQDAILMFLLQSFAQQNQAAYGPVILPN